MAVARERERIVSSGKCSFSRANNVPSKIIIVAVGIIVFDVASTSEERKRMFCLRKEKIILNHEMKERRERVLSDNGRASSRRARIIVVAILEREDIGFRKKMHLHIPS